MAGAGYTHSQIAVMLIDGCLAHIAGDLQGKMPIAGEPVADLARAGVGLPQKGQTVHYPLAGGGVFIDLSGSVATVWFIDGDFDSALSAMESSMKRKYRVKQLADEAGDAPKHRRRNYEVDFGNSRLAHVMVNYAERGATSARFLVRVVAQVRK